MPIEVEATSKAPADWSFADYNNGEKDIEGFLRNAKVHFHRLQAFYGWRHPLACGPLCKVLSGEDRHHPVNFQRKPGVNALDARMRVRRTHKTGVQGTGDFHIIDISSLSGQKAVIFLARCVLAYVMEVFLTHG